MKNSEKEQKDVLRIKTIENLLNHDIHARESKIQLVEKDQLYYLEILIPITSDPKLCKKVKSTSKPDDDDKKSRIDVNLEANICDPQNNTIQISFDDKPISTTEDGDIKTIFTVKAILDAKIPGTGGDR